MGVFDQTFCRDCGLPTRICSAFYKREGFGCSFMLHRFKTVEEAGANYEAAVKQLTDEEFEVLLRNRTRPTLAKFRDKIISAETERRANIKPDTLWDRLLGESD
jgi:hypothetical protein